MVDVARHFWKVEDLKKYIDVMAAYKFNRLHLHLTDDQGWRVEHPNWPKLKDVAARRQQTDGDGKPHAGSYSRADLRDIVRYAASRYVTVVPELEVPGHASALLAAYPELACFPKEDFKTATEPGVYKELLCPAKPKVLELYRDLYQLLGEVFPGETIHLGGREAPPDRWQDCPNCRELGTKERLADTLHQMSWFLKRMSRLLPPGKKPMFWFEEGVGDYPSGASVVSRWQGRTPSILDLAAKGGWPVVVSPAEQAYFDYPQAKDDLPKVGWMPVTTLQQTYDLDPGYGLPVERQKAVLGAEGTLWGEYVSDLPRAFYMTYPRGLALAEACWSPMSVRTWDNFRRKARAHAVALKSRGIEIGPIP
jgi:hexosaminidase